MISGANSVDKKLAYFLKKPDRMNLWLNFPSIEPVSAE